MPMYVFYFVKMYKGMAWFFFRGRTYKAFLAYYRVSMTFNFSVLAFLVELIFVSFSYGPGWYQHYHILQWLILVWYVTECICLEVHMRHLDRVKIAKNELLRDRSILHVYYA